MSEVLDKYLSLLEKFKKTHDNEDSLLDEMDAVWLDLTDEERAKLQE